MASGPGIRVTTKLIGMDRVEAGLRDLGSGLKGEGLADCLVAGALIVQNEAKTTAPYLTGTLRRSIHTESRVRSETNVYALVGTDVEYARRIEYGFVGRDKLGRVYDQAARPYMRPALDANREAVRREIKAAIAAKVRESVSRR